jgi:ammonium transporter Rh
MTLSVSKLFSSESKFRPMDIQNATLAGGVAIGAAASLSLSPFNALIIGATSGVVSTVG